MRHIRLLTTALDGVALSAGAVGPVSAGPVHAAQGSPPPTPGRWWPAFGRRRDGPPDHRPPRDRGIRRPADGVGAPGPERDRIVFQTFEQDGHLTVLPSDAAPLVSRGRLDRRLFDVTSLLAQGYDDAHADALPLIVGMSGTSVTATAASMAPMSSPPSSAATVRPPAEPARVWRRAPTSSSARCSETTFSHLAANGPSGQRPQRLPSRRLPGLGAAPLISRIRRRPARLGHSPPSGPAQ